MNQTAFAFPASTHRAVRHRKAVEATERADSDTPTWSQQAYHYLVMFAKQREGEWLAEEYIWWATTSGLPKPEDKRAFGSLFPKAVRAGVIVRAGVSKATRNASWKPTYSRGGA